MLDPIADMLTRIRNAQRAGHLSVSMPASKLKLAIAETLLSRGFIGGVAKHADETGKKETLEITLRYVEKTLLRRDPAITGIRRVSKEGCRVYAKKGEIRKVKNGYGVAVISTSQGVMSGEDAYKKGLGGEYLCEVW
ncbi:MAG: 30S ribosomal protein S8 [Candidatus Moranbacteria bacterium]|nr:30S ribosomal protein S8 [Candidatus Moranbacteria bacterium]NTW46156.1 30S ribosomal protein S8 [Candidatus Moranbacteria bacterium]